MKIVTLLENTACRENLAHAHGLSLYIETPRHKILFDAGPNEDFLVNAKTLGVDLRAVDLAVLSHGHYDHGGGLAAFCALNSRAKIYIHPLAFGDFYALDPGREPEYIGLSPQAKALGDRLVRTGDRMDIDGELTLFSAVPEDFSTGGAGARLQEKTETGFRPETFRHEQNLLVQTGETAALFAGCAHRGVVNILQGARAILGRLPDAVFGGFHLFQTDPESPADNALIDATGQALLPGSTVYYTGHCTGDYACGRLSAILGDRLRPMTGGTVVEM